MTKKHYIAIAKAIRDNTTIDTYGDEHLHKDDLITDLCIIFKKDNILFNSTRFIDACDDV